MDTITPTDTITTTHRYRIYPRPSQLNLLARTFGSVRFVYNKLLASAIAAYEEYKPQQFDPMVTAPSVTGISFANQLPMLKIQYPWLKDVSSVALQQVAMHLGKAYGSFFSSWKDSYGKTKVAKLKHGHPKFHKYSNNQSFHLVGEAFHVKDNQLYIAKLNKSIPIRWSRPLPSEPSSLTITRNPAGEYHACFVVQQHVEQGKGNGIVGADPGVKNQAVVSDGQVFPNPKHQDKEQGKLAYMQRCASKKQLGSKNRAKANRKAAKVHQHIVNQRQDYLHKITTKLVKENRVIVIEDLNVKGMMANHHLARAVAGASMASFTKMLEYKAIRSKHCTILQVDQWFPSTQLCSVCDTKSATKIKLGVSQWTCSECGTHHDRDMNAAKNLEKVALRNTHRWVNDPGKLVHMDER